MQTNQILSASLIDIVFDGRNKDYGAYELRQHYSQRIGRALLVTAVIVSIAFGGAAIAGSMKKAPKKFVINEQTLTSIKDEEKPKLPDPPKPKPTEQVTRTEKLVTLKLVDKPDVTPPPSMDDLAKADIGLDKHDGIDPSDIVAPKSDIIDSGKHVIDIKPREDDNPLTTVEVDASYPGDWKKFLEKNLNPDVPVNHEAPAGRYSVVIRFVVDKEGNVSDITALTAHGYGMEEEAIRVIRKATKWIPAFQNGTHVKAYRKQVIVFEVTD